MMISMRLIRRVPSSNLLLTTLVNFVEGTRANHEKLSTVKTPYRHLLKPKTGGVAFALSAMGPILDGIVDVTLAYPENQILRLKTCWKVRWKRWSCVLNCTQWMRTSTVTILKIKRLNAVSTVGWITRGKRKMTILIWFMGLKRPCEVETTDEPDAVHKKRAVTSNQIDIKKSR